MAQFKDSFKFGLIGESEVCAWLKKKGFTVIPVSDTLNDSNKGPRIFSPEEPFVAPDIMVFKDGRFMFIECKLKTGFGYHRMTGQFTTGIDLKHYQEYIKVMNHFKIEVWLFFLHLGGQAKDAPESESGLFGNRLSYLCKMEDHRHRNGGRAGMVYWSKNVLMKLAEIKDF